LEATEQLHHHGFYGKEATGQISQIEEKRGSETRRFDEGERFLKKRTMPLRPMLSPDETSIG